MMNIGIKTVLFLFIAPPDIIRCLLKPYNIARQANRAHTVEVNLSDLCGFKADKI
jgi:hypothetical protein